MKSITKDETPETVTIVDRPERNTSIVRVSGPFTVEATIQASMSLDDAVSEAPRAVYKSPRAYLDRMIELLRQSKTLQLPRNVSLQFEGISPLADREYLHAEGVAKNGADKRIAFVLARRTEQSAPSTFSTPIPRHCSKASSNFSSLASPSRRRLAKCWTS